ncbi:ATP-binding protein [Phycicoccus sp. SLBN-51]|jgi:sensor histidine kinase regulating citrate/malate metabolism|uniref:sensor histidine kinase n=1 Tax=Phycicoccus sp. SLBN-51 TaxID=2768447 RepID=UPI00115380A7|nr:ATP-binding protein [Phycicoccus sp. SLBN-51]TQJ48712.1 sensor histidine kinase regulating citrate/malate metabolism [Phycicoccus sp. SLBN-51]
MRALRRSTLAGQLLVFQVALVIVVLVAVGALSLAQSEATFNRVEGRRASALAEQLAANPLVRDNLAIPEQRTGLATLAQQFVVQSRVTTVTVADADERVRVSTDPIIERSPLPLGDRGVGTGSSWSGTMDVNGDRELVSQVPVLSVQPGEVGKHLGTVMITVDFPSVWERLRGASSYLLTYLGTALVLGLLGSWLLARRIKHQTLGLEPREIAGLAEHREALLYGIAEGVIALDPQNRITLVNDVARRLLDLPEHAAGVSLADLRIQGRLRDVLSGEGDARDEVVIRRGRVLVMNRMAVEKDGHRLGTVTTLRDRTELAQLEREIGSFRSSTQLLRAQAHEFANQLHTISGLIQIGEYDEVVSYVDAVSRHRESLDLTVNRRVHDNAVAALLMAKSSLAAERRVELRISGDTSLERLEPADSADVATVVGNLVDNAIDAATGSPDAWVEVALHQDATTVEVVVRDSGPGVAPEVAQEVFTHGFTTKAAASGERGIGLALTRLVCQRRGGEVALSNTEDGAMFRAQLTVTAVAGAVTEAVS